MIRLARTGARKKPNYRVVVIDKARARNGRFVEIVGHYDPRKNPAVIALNAERVEYWQQRGAQLSETVRSFLSRQKNVTELQPEPLAQTKVPEGPLPEQTAHTEILELPSHEPTG